ncbi:MAG TPA: RraA family protein [Bryobacteraceae bacterium]|nr:RraA family protein [Bryobacteraceae bacterium]
MDHHLTAGQLDAIRQFDTCTISNAIEEFGVRLRNEGYTRPGLHCMFPELGSMLGYAVTSRIKTSNPPPAGRHYYYDRTDWWDLMIKRPAPHVAVIQDIDENRGIGASVGEVHGSILHALKCVGVVTNGAVRDLAAVRSMRFPLFACHVSVSHAYVHMVDFGHPVEICGLKIHSGDLLYGDCHGVLSIPGEIAGEVAAKAAELMKHERTVIDLCRSPEFSIERLQHAVKELQ